MLLNNLLRGKGRRPVGSNSKRSARPHRPCLEGLEKREVMTVAFTPAFGPDSIFWRTSVGGHTANSVLTGPVSNPTVLNNPTVYLIFSGSSWTGTTAAKYAGDVKTILSSPYLSGLTQYGSSGTAVYGGYTIDSRTSPGPSGRDAEIQYALDHLSTSWAKPTGVAPNPGGNNAGAAGYLHSPVYVVVDDNGDNSAANGGGFYTSGGTTYLTNAINIDNGSYEDTFTDLFSHELVERVSDGTGAGIGMNGPSNVPGDGEYQNAQIADNEPDEGRYTYRLGGTVKVQAYWSVVDQKFIVPDGNQQTIVLRPIWNGTSFTNTFDVSAVQAAPGGATPTNSVIDAAKTKLTLGNETFNLSATPVRNVSVFTLTNTSATGRVWEISGPGTTWTAITGTNTNATQLTTDGTSTFMLASNGGAARVWKYNGSSSSWTAVTGTNTNVSQIGAAGGKMYMLGNNGGANQVYQYSGAGTGWTAVTGANSSVSQMVSAGDRLFMLGNNGGANQVYQYSGAGTGWTAVTGANSSVSKLVSSGGSLYMLANNGGANRVYKYSGSSTGWTAVTGANTSISGLVACGDRVFMLANNGGANQVYQYSGAGTGWTAVTGTNTVVSDIYVTGNALFMDANNGGANQTWQYSGSGTSWTTA
jgi:hypothetical protein